MLHVGEPEPRTPVTGVDAQHLLEHDPGLLEHGRVLGRHGALGQGGREAAQGVRILRSLECCLTQELDGAREVARQALEVCERGVGGVGAVCARKLEANTSASQVALCQERVAGGELELSYLVLQVIDSDQAAHRRHRRHQGEAEGDTDGAGHRAVRELAQAPRGVGREDREGRQPIAW